MQTAQKSVQAKMQHQKFKQPVTSIPTKTYIMNIEQACLLYVIQ